MAREGHPNGSRLVVSPVQVTAILWVLLPLLLVTDLSRTLVEVIVLWSGALSIICYRSIRPDRWTHLQRGLLGIFGVFLVLTLISQVVSPEPWRGLDQIRSFHLKLLALVTFGIILFRYRQNWYLIGTGFCVALAASVAAGGMELGFGRWFMPWPLSPEHRTAISPFGENKNQFGSYLAWMIPVVFCMGCYHYESVRKEGYRPIFVLFGLTLAGLVALILSESRAAQAGCAVSLASVISLVLLRWGINKNTVRILGVLLILLGGVLLLYHDLLILRWTESSMGDWSGRLTDIYPATLEAAEERLWFGYDFSKESFLQNTATEEVHEHNIYLFFLLRSGLVGLAGFLLLVLALLITTVLFLWKQKDSLLFWMGGGMFSAFVGSILVDGIATNPYPFFLELNLALLIGINCALPIKEGGEDPPVFLHSWHSNNRE